MYDEDAVFLLQITLGLITHNCAMALKKVHMHLHVANLLFAHAKTKVQISYMVSQARFSEIETLSALGDTAIYFNVFWHDKLKFCLLIGRQEVEF